MFHTYILYSLNFKKFYIGQTEDIERRFSLHNKGSGAQPGMPSEPRQLVKSTAPYQPWTLVGSIPKPTRSESMILERKLKNLNREDLLRFIHRYLPDTTIDFTKL